MEEFAARFAEILEQIAIKIRIARGLRLTGLGILAATLALSALLFLMLTVFAALEIPLTTAGAFAVVGAVLIGAGSFLWFRRTRGSNES
jgi:membrane-bound ClpP family serine protease